MEWLDEYPFLSAGLEDYVLALELSFSEIGKPRHVVCLMHDVVEFLLYEILISIDYDIYKSGQNTIGLDEALSACTKRGVEIPLIGTIRSIQKHRGDAKHHAQTPQDNAYMKMLSEFRIITSRLIHEHFGHVLEYSFSDVDITPYHWVIHDCYQKYRNHNWKFALRFATGAVLHQYRDALDRPDDFITGHTQDIFEIIKHLEKEIKTPTESELALKINDLSRGLPKELRKLMEDNEIALAAKAASNAFEKIAEIVESTYKLDEVSEIQD